MRACCVVIDTVGMFNLFAVFIVYCANPIPQLQTKPLTRIIYYRE